MREFVRGAGFPTRFVGYETTEVDTSVGALQRADDGTPADEVPGEPLLRRRAAARSPTPGVVETRLRRGARRGRLPRSATTRPWRSRSSGASCARASGCGSIVDREARHATDVQPHRHAPAARRAARAARHARAPGRLGRAARTSCASTSRTASALSPRGAARDRGPGQRVDRSRAIRCARSTRRAGAPRSWARWRCSARSTATRCA